MTDIFVDWSRRRGPSARRPTFLGYERGAFHSVSVVIGPRSRGAIRSRFAVFALNVKCGGCSAYERNKESRPTLTRSRPSAPGSGSARAGPVKGTSGLRPRSSASVRALDRSPAKRVALGYWVAMTSSLGSVGRTGEWRRCRDGRDHRCARPATSRSFFSPGVPRRVRFVAGAPRAARPAPCARWPARQDRATSSPRRSVGVADHRPVD